MDHIELTKRLARSSGPVTFRELVAELMAQLRIPGGPYLELADEALATGLEEGWLETYDDEEFPLAYVYVGPEVGPLVRPKIAYRLLGTGIRLDMATTYRARYATNQPRWEETGKVFVNRVLLWRGEYDIVPEPEED